MSPIRYVLFSASYVLLTGFTFAADEEVFSGPQVGEPLTPFLARGVLGENANKEFDLVKQADGKPIVIFFVHDVTRPSIGLTRGIMSYASKRAKDGLTSGVVFLSGDVTETESWMKRAPHALPKNVPAGISDDGREGPGAYGLNRNVTLTVVVGNENKVTANFALVQPSAQADGPKIAKAIVDVLGGGPVPSLAQLELVRRRPDAKNARGRMQDPKMESLLRAVIQKTATDEQVKVAAAAVEAYAKKNEAARKRIGEIATNIINAGKLENYGTPAAQQVLTKWAKEFGPKPERKRTP
jgi:hypothetical protein